MKIDHILKNVTSHTRRHSSTHKLPMTENMKCSHSETKDWIINYSFCWVIKCFPRLREYQPWQNYQMNYLSREQNQEGHSRASHWNPKKKKKPSSFSQRKMLDTIGCTDIYNLHFCLFIGVSSNKNSTYVQSVPHDTRIRPSVDAVRPRTAPWWPGNWQTVRLYFYQKIKWQNKYQPQMHRFRKY